MSLDRLALTASLGLLLLVSLAVTVPARLAGQARGGLDPASILQPLGDSWPTYSGDYTGRRYSRLAQVTTQTVAHLTLAWTQPLNASVPGAAAGGGGRGFRRRALAHDCRRLGTGSAFVGGAQ
jgi:alcohol dehydrogenase (cytochrome c)